MRQLIRWGKFNLVGAIGMEVQLASLAVLHHVLHGHLLLALAIAIEITLLHNFLWHMRYTWADRRDSTSRLQQLVRFHVSNGAVSMLGNLALTPLLVRQGPLPLLVANGVAILCCSAANFWLGNIWAFTRSKEPEAAITREHRLLTLSAFIVALLLFTNAGIGRAQKQLPPTPHLSGGLGTDCAYENVFAGPAVTVAGHSKASFIAGVTAGQYFARDFGKGVVPSPQFEVGVVGPVQGGYQVDGFASFNEMFANKVGSHHLYSFLTGGYTRFFVTGNAANFGLGFEFGKNEYKRTVRIELRDYYLFTGPRQHVFGLRIGLGKFISD